MPNKKSSNGLNLNAYQVMHTVRPKVEQGILVFVCVLQPLNGSSLGYCTTQEEISPYYFTEKHRHVQECLLENQKHDIQT